jgi:hypothetical protein
MQSIRPIGLHLQRAVVGRAVVCASLPIDGYVFYLIVFFTTKKEQVNMIIKYIIQKKVISKGSDQVGSNIKYLIIKLIPEMMTEITTVA